LGDEILQIVHDGAEVTRHPGVLEERLNSIFEGELLALFRPSLVCIVDLISAIGDVLS
jgi:hypothetical protein